MSLPVLGLMVVAGIAAIVAAVHFTGGTLVATLSGEADARSRFLLEYGDEQIGAVHLSSDRRSAVLELGGGRIGVVGAWGDRFLVRRLKRGEGLRIEVLPGTGLALHLADPTWRRLEFRVADSEAATITRILSGPPDGEEKAA